MPVLGVRERENRVESESHTVGERPCEPISPMSRKCKMSSQFLGEEAWGFRPGLRDGGSQGRSPYR
jgi:hypothetical protein